MRRNANIRRAKWFVVFLAVVVCCASLAAAQTIDPKNFESNSLLFVQQDVLPSFGDTGVRIGTVKGMISGNITTNFTFTVPPPKAPPGADFVADDVALIIDPEGDQILFKVHSEGTASFDTLSSDIVPFRAPFLATYTVDKATGKLSKYEGLVFPARGTAVVSSLILFGNVPGAPVGTVYVEVSRNPIH